MFTLQPFPPQTLLYFAVCSKLFLKVLSSLKYIYSDYLQSSRYQKLICLSKGPESNPKTSQPRCWLADHTASLSGIFKLCSWIGCRTLDHSCRSITITTAPPPLRPIASYCSIIFGLKHLVDSEGKKNLGLMSTTRLS